MVDLAHGSFSSGRGARVRVVLIAGPNGAGKSTFAAEYFGGEGGSPPFVNGDDVAADLNPADPSAVAARAARIALRQMDAHVASGADFAVESTLSGRAYAARLKRWQAMGYWVSIIYLRLSSADQAVERVARRVAEGGHRVPEPVVRRRFARSWRNFLELYRDVADEWRVYDNSGEAPILIARSPGWYKVKETIAPRGRTMETEKLGKIPNGEPSDEGVLAALVRARNRALARAAAVRRGERAETLEDSTDRSPVADGSTGPLVIAGRERDG